jgi:quinolinate synthase
VDKIQQKIFELKKKRDAIILAHNYQLPEIYDVADFIGDSFELALKAREAEAKTIIFCGVHFMAESAKILNPTKRVLIPDLTAGCPMADMVTAEDLRNKKKELPEAAVVCYVNSTAEVKAESDVCVTSSNALKIVSKLPEKQILFVPDEHLGSWVGEQLPEKEIIPWLGFCVVHTRVSPEKIHTAQKAHSEAVTLAHPECPKEIRDLADHVCGTGGMVRYVRENPVTEFLVATEPGMLERLRREAPEKKYYSLCTECVNMKKITPEKVLGCLENDEFEISVLENVAAGARKALDKMIELS